MSEYSRDLNEDMDSGQILADERIRELEEQLDMLRALVEAEKGRGKDVSRAERWLDEADSALQSDNLLLAREKLQAAGDALGVKLP